MKAEKPKSLGERVKSRRNELDLTQKDVAGIAKIKQPCLSAIERDETKLPDIKAKTLEGLARALVTSVAYLRGTEKPGPITGEAELVLIYRRLEMTEDGPKRQENLVAYARGVLNGATRQREARPLAPQSRSKLLVE